MPENKELCKKCGGKCCKDMSGMYAPSDFKEVTIESMIKSLNTGIYSLDWWEGDPRTNIPEEDKLHQTYFIRPRHLRASIIDPSWGGICIHLHIDGCNLQYKDRPSNCRDLIPNIDSSKCHMIKTKANRVIEWIPYQDILSECYSEFIDK
jgi:Fe-S-cluster containining protein